MEVPANIKKEHLLRAIEKIDGEGIPLNSDSKYYDLIFNGKTYPPKVLVSLANEFANGYPLDRDYFRGGEDTPAFRLLKENGFEIIKKGSIRTMNYYSQLIEFLAQVKTGSQKTLLYDKEFKGLNTKISFGQGGQAKVPWIAFLDNHNTVSNGIYPVYLYYKDINLLILAYGVSETNEPSSNWSIKEPVTISDYFSKNDLGKPHRYGGSYVFKAYDTSKTLNPEQIEHDLQHIIDTYKGLTYNTIQFKQDLYFAFANKAKLNLSKELVLRFISSLLSKPFVILTGLSGSGKTKLAESFAKWICADNSQYCLVPVGADWTNREPLLGFPNALSEEQYVKPDNGALDLILEAKKNGHLPYFLILDEMNLSHVERYFADFLSVMETSGSIYLHANNKIDDVPKEVALPSNLFVIGTVNIDETTYMFSPKVLDRANVIEFRITASDMESYLNSNSQLDLSVLESKGADMASSFVDLANDKSIRTKDTSALSATLMAFFNELKLVGAEFGYRSAAEISRFVGVAQRLNEAWEINEIIDAAIMQKLLPKLHGSRRKLEGPLKTMGKLCLVDSNKDMLEVDALDATAVKYPLSLEKIQRMHKSLIINGFTSYAEA